jgi:RNA polymerase sigma-70 factor (ECF subfamily)
MNEAEMANDLAGKELLLQLRAGDEEALAQFMAAYQKKIFRLAYAFFRDREEALDIVQETFMRVYEKIDYLKKETNVERWLFQIARHLCIDRYRRKKSQKRGAEFNHSTTFSILVKEVISPEKSSELRQLIGEALERLSPRQKLIFILKHINELQFDEIAQVLGIAPGTVKSLHFKALRHLRQHLEPLLGGQE